MDFLNIEELEGFVVVDVTKENHAQLGCGSGVALNVHRHVETVTSCQPHQQLGVNPSVVPAC